MNKILWAVVVVGSLLILTLLFDTCLNVKNSSIAAETSGEAVILFMQGDVKVKSVAVMIWEDAAAGMVLSKGVSLKTGPDSWAEIGFGKNYSNAVRIKEVTAVELSELGPIRISLLNGEIRSLVESLSKGSTFEIRTPTAVCGVRGTGLDTATDGKKVTVDTYEEQVFFDRLAPDGTVLGGKIVTAGNRGVLEDPNQSIELQRVPPERMLDWFNWKKRFLQKRMELLQKDIDEKVKKIKK